MTSALDPELVADVLDVIRELAHDGMTMLIATHEMGFARDIASRVCFLADSQIVEQAPPGQLFTEPSDERTRRFLRRIVDAGRMYSAPLVTPPGQRPRTLGPGVAAPSCRITPSSARERPGGCGIVR